MQILNPRFKSHSITKDLAVGFISGILANDNIGKINIYSLPAARVLENIVNKSVSGDKSAIYELGTMYEGGALFVKDLITRLVESVPENHQTAKALFLVAEARGSAEASLRLGLMAHHGIGQEVNKDAASTHFERGALLDEPTCVRIMGIYAHERGDSVKSKEWFERGADLGDPICCFNVAVSLTSGDSGHRDKDKALKLLRVAATKMPDDHGINNLIAKLKEE